MNEKEQRLGAYCKTHGYDGALLRKRANIAWLTDGADTHVDGANALGIATVLWTPGRKTVFTNNIEAGRLRDEEFSKEWAIESVQWTDSPKIPDGRYLTDVPEDALTDLRATLTAEEMQRARQLGRECGAILEGVMRRVERGWTEHAIAAELVGDLRTEGIFAPVALVAVDDRIEKYRHPIPTSRKVERVAMGVVCAQRQGLIVCLTRLVHFGPLPGELTRKHEAVCLIDRTLHEATRPGRRWCDILAEGIAAYRETGFADEWTLHHQGGPMGYECRDYVATPAETRTVAANQLVGWNPSITGTKSEDTILSTGEVLTGTGQWPLMANGRPAILVK
ncbi:MAG: hypothetical protein AMXMBFR47_40940 [Planctomycetota bacterium]